MNKTVDVCLEISTALSLMKQCSLSQRWARGLLRAVSEPRLIGSEVGVRLIGVTIAFSGFLKAILGVRLMYTRDSTTHDYGSLASKSLFCKHSRNIQAQF